MRSPAKWWRSIKRRKPGVYVYRTRRHLAPWRTEWGYAGKSRNLNIRHTCHAGTCGLHQGCKQKPWFDLITRRYTIRLPWWLGWDWITLSMETLLIWLLRPRYNIQKNPSRHKVAVRIQQVQRQVRLSQPATYRAKVMLTQAASVAIIFTAISMVLIGIGGYLWNR